MGRDLVRQAIADLKKGKFVLVHDVPTRENEVDFVLPAQFATSEAVARMRKDGGGLICATLHPTIARNLGLPYMTQIYEEACKRFPVLKALSPPRLPYDERSAFSISVNSRRTRTGITDEDRATTLRELAEVGELAMKGPTMDEFTKRFRSPGHVPLLPAAEGLLRSRKGHTELSVRLLEMAGLIPVGAICEMLDSSTHRALSLEDARKYAEEHGYVLLTCSDIEEYEGSGSG